jgi:MoaD family protein
MKLKVKLLKPLSDIVGNKELHLDLEGRTLEDLLKVLVGKYPKLKDQLYSRKESLSDHVNVFVNDKPVTDQDEMSTRLHDGDEILLFIPISGG